MQKKNETVDSVSSNFIPKPILPKNLNSARDFDQKNYDSSVSAGLVGSPRDSYLTYTDKSPSNRGQKSTNFQESSMNLYLKTMQLCRNDKKMLQRLHHLGFHKIKFINYNNIVLYSPSNPAGNSNAGWKLAQNISNSDKARLASKQNAYEKALANVELWEYFATFTLDKTKQDRYDFKKALTHITKFLQYRHIKYFMVPERHKDGAWHFHALLSAEMGEYLSDFEGKALKNWYIRSCLSQGKPIKHCKAYSESFGYNTIEPCRDKERCTHYMTKYVLKTFDDENFERVSRRRFFCSKGLKSPVIIMPSEINLEDFEIQALSQYTEKVYLRRFEPPHFAYEHIQHEPPAPPYSLNRKPG
jgi:hypothetical protein